MKLNFKKISAIAGSVLMTGLTIGTAAAASFPAPFVQSGTANVALVYGASSTDMPAVTSIKTKLDSVMPAGSVTVDGESVMIERAADKFNLGDSASSVFITSINKEHLPTLLGDVTLKGEDNKDYKYTQKVQLSNNLNLTHFRDYDYNKDDPTIGITLEPSVEVLTYQIDFTTAPNMSDDVMRYTELNILGKNYFISELSNSSNTITLLDSASPTTSLIGDEQKTVGEYTVSITNAVIDSTTHKATLSVNGKTTGSLARGDVYRIADDVYLGVKDVQVATRERDEHRVEFVIGSGKIELRSGSTILLNDKNVRELTTTFTKSNSLLNSIAITWKTDDREFITPESSLTMPLFGSLGLAMSGMTFPTGEDISVLSDSARSIRLTAPIRDGTANLNILYTGENVSSGFTGIGRDVNNKLVTSGTTSLTFNETLKDRYFVVSWYSGSESQTYLASASITEDSSDIARVSVRNELTGTNFCENVANGSTCTVGNVILTASAVNATTGNVYATFTTTTANAFNTLYTAKGLKLTLPWVNTTAHTLGGTNKSTAAAACAAVPLTSTALAYAGVLNFTADGEYGTNLNQTTCTFTSTTAGYVLNFAEANPESDARGTGTTFNLTLNATGGTSGSEKVQVSGVSITSHTPTSGHRIMDTDDYVGYVGSRYATKVLHKTGGDQDYAELTYYGGEVSGNFYVASADATSTTGNPLGNVIYKDTEVTDTVKAKNLIVVGGSCINSVAADLLGGAYCGSAFTTATGISNGEALLKAYPNKYTNGKVVVLVAGYEAADTQMGATYLINKNVDTSTVSSKVTTVTNAVDHALPA